tara:strand:+ start:1319 stop:3253 length:1935 start_codon:yes stop_codon:yes gene_type:complete
MKKQLTSEQKQIVEHTIGHALVKAVPGSGKTTTLIMRVAYLIRIGVNPNNILILMFNKAAQLSFKEKLEIKLKKDGVRIIPEVRTFHSLAIGLLKKAEIARYIKKKDILDTNHYKYKQILKQCTNQVDSIRNSDLEALQLQISNWRLEGVTSADLYNDPTYKDVTGYEKSAYFNYLKLMEEYNFRTFDDALIEAVNLVQSNPSFLPDFQYMIVDEYQDVNYIQNEFVKHLAREHSNVMVVGDVNQCIYEWRGSKSDFIQGIFQNQFSGTTIYHLSYTFRFGKKLSNAANSVIYKNKEYQTTQCVSHINNPNTIVKIHHDMTFLSFLNCNISEFQMGSTVILGRAKSDLVVPELLLQMKDIPYRNISSKLGLILRPELSFLTVLFCLSLDGNISKLKGLYDMKKVIRNFIMQLNLWLDKGVQNTILDKVSINVNSFWQVLDKYIPLQHSHNLKIISALKKISNQFNEATSARELFHKINAEGLLEGISESSVLITESNDQLRGITSIETLLDSLGITCNKFIDIMIRPSINTQSKNCFELSTMHNSKGLEWDNVIIVGLYDKEFPGQSDGVQREKPSSDLSQLNENIKESRRLFYVAITRAITQLHLLVPKDDSLKHWQKNGWSSTPKKPVIATRFVFEMNLKLT